MEKPMEELEKKVREALINKAIEDDKEEAMERYKELYNSLLSLSEYYLLAQICGSDVNSFVEELAQSTVENFHVKKNLLQYATKEDFDIVYGRIENDVNNSYLIKSALGKAVDIIGPDAEKKLIDFKNAKEELVMFYSTQERLIQTLIVVAKSEGVERALLHENEIKNTIPLYHIIYERGIEILTTVEAIECANYALKYLTSMYEKNMQPK